jgi:hypothetical protein
VALLYTINRGNLLLAGLAVFAYSLTCLPPRNPFQILIERTGFWSSPPVPTASLVSLLRVRQ